MSSSWKNEKASDPDGRPSTSVDGGTVPPSEPSTSQKPIPARKEKAPPSNTPSTPLTTHDAIVKDMDERLEAVRVAGLPSKSDSHSSSSDSAGSPEPTYGRRTRPMEAITDAFSGQNIGLMSPQECDRSQDDMWTHLKQIRGLQIEIAGMHAQMEGLGGNEREPRRRETTGDDDAINVEEEVKAAKTAEFSKLADRFTGRKDAIDAVMAKLETLSQTINDFHSTRTPALHFDSSSPDQASPAGNEMSEALLNLQKQSSLTDAHVIQDSLDLGAGLL